MTATRKMGPRELFSAWSAPVDDDYGIEIRTRALPVVPDAFLERVVAAVYDALSDYLNDASSDDDAKKRFGVYVAVRDTAKVVAACQAAEREAFAAEQDTTRTGDN